MTQNSPKFKQINILEHIYIVCMHCLPQSYYRKPLSQPYALQILLVKSWYSKIKEKRTDSFSYISVILYLKWLQLHLYKRLHHFTTWYTKKMHVLYCHESDVELSHPPSLTRPIFLAPSYGTASFLDKLNQHQII